MISAASLTSNRPRSLPPAMFSRMPRAPSIEASRRGLVIAWRIESTQGFHAIMNLILIPIWMLSGAFFPVDGAP